MLKTVAVAAFLLALGMGFAAAQANSPITVLWPSGDKPSLKLTFGSFQQSAIVNGQGDLRFGRNGAERVRPGDSAVCVYSTRVGQEWRTHRPGPLATSPDRFLPYRKSAGAVFCGGHTGGDHAFGGDSDSTQGDFNSYRSQFQNRRRGRWRNAEVGRLHYRKPYTRIQQRGLCNGFDAHRSQRRR